MRDYDWGFGFGFGTRYPIRRQGYDRGMGGGGYGRNPMGGGPRGFGGGRSGQGGYGQPGRYDRGIYGDDYPVFGGIPGGPREGMYYGGRGRAGGYGADFGRGGGRGRPGADRFPGGAHEHGAMGGGWGGEQPRGRYDRDHAREPFLPEEAYGRHPELNRPPLQWRQERQGGQFGEVWPDDVEIEYEVRQNLYLDNFLDPDRIEVEVENGIVTLRGEVDDFLEARYAWDDAWDSVGVRGVVNLLTVRTDLPDGERGSGGAEGQGSLGAEGNGGTEAPGSET